MKKRVILFGFIPLLFINITKVYANEPSIGTQIKYKFNPEDYTPKGAKYIDTKICSNESIKTKEVEGWMWGNESNDFPTKVISIYEIGVIEAPYFHEVVGYLPTGSTYEFGSRVLKEFDYSSQVSLSTKEIYKGSLSAEGKIHDIKALADFGKEVQLQISSSITATTKCEIESYYKVTIPVTEDGYYFHDIRATYKLFEIQEYSIKNTRKFKERKRSGLALDIYYSVDSLATCTNISYVCEFITSCGQALVKYNQTSDGKFEYSGPKSNNKIIYI